MLPSNSKSTNWSVISTTAPKLVLETLLYKLSSSAYLFVSFSMISLDTIIHSSGLSQIEVSLELDEDVFASVGKIISSCLPTVVKNSLFFPLRFNFITGDNSFTVISLKLI